MHSLLLFFVSLRWQAETSIVVVIVGIIFVVIVIIVIASTIIVVIGKLPALHTWLHDGMQPR